MMNINRHLKTQAKSRQVESRVVASLADDIDGYQAIAHFSPNYGGAVCVITLKEVIAVLPNVEEALKVAAYAITPSGGYGSVSMLEAIHEFPTHRTFQEWLDKL